MLSSGSVLIATLTVALIGVSLCAGKQILRVTADSVLDQVCVNGASQPLSFNKTKVKLMDNIVLEDGWNGDGRGCISIKASHTNIYSKPGILACVTSEGAQVGFTWRCSSAKKDVFACCGTCRSSKWYEPDAKRLLRYPLSLKRHSLKTIAELRDQCVGSTGEIVWRWDKRGARLHKAQVCCTLLVGGCASLCSSCKIKGFNKCDPGKCLFGTTGIVDAPSTHVCNYKCCVEVTASRNYLVHPTYKLTNMATSTVTTKVCGQPFCVAILDIETCQAQEHADLGGYPYDDQSYGVTNQWEIDQANINMPYLHLASGADPIPSAYERLPWIEIGGLNNVDTSKRTYNPLIGDNYVFASVCFTGYKGGYPKTSNTVMKV